MGQENKATVDTANELQVLASAEVIASGTLVSRIAACNSVGNTFPVMKLSMCGGKAGGCAPAAAMEAVADRHAAMRLLSHFEAVAAEQALAALQNERVRCWKRSACGAAERALAALQKERLRRC